MSNTYTPKPIDVSYISLSNDLMDLIESIAQQVHEIWALNRVDDGWEYGEQRNDELKQTPCLVPYDQLPEEEKLYDRETAMATIKFILSQGYEIRKRNNKKRKP